MLIGTRDKLAVRMPRTLPYHRTFSQRLARMPGKRLANRLLSVDRFDELVGVRRDFAFVASETDHLAALQHDGISNAMFFLYSSIRLPCHAHGR